MPKGLKQQEIVNRVWRLMKDDCINETIFTAKEREIIYGYVPKIEELLTKRPPNPSNTFKKGLKWFKDKIITTEADKNIDKCLKYINEENKKQGMEAKEITRKKFKKLIYDYEFEFRFVDGGINSNTPWLLAYTEAQCIWQILIYKC